MISKKSPSGPGPEALAQGGPGHKFFLNKFGIHLVFWQGSCLLCRGQVLCAGVKSYVQGSKFCSYVFLWRERSMAWALYGVSTCACTVLVLCVYCACTLRVLCVYCACTVLVLCVYCACTVRVLCVWFKSCWSQFCQLLCMWFKNYWSDVWGHFSNMQH